MECSPCSDGCRICVEDPDVCPECKAPSYKLPNVDVCRTYCPSALGTDDDARLCLEDPPQDICFEFSDKQYDLTVNTVSTVYTGEAVNAPYTVKGRGIYLRAATELDVVDLVLNTRFSVEFIIRPDIAGDLLTIVTDTGDAFLMIDLAGNTLNFNLKDSSTT